MEKASTVKTGPTIPAWLAAILQVMIAALLPLLLILINAGLLMLPAFMRFEYTRPGFPADPYGFTTEDRLEYGPRGLAYLFNNEGIEYLGNMRFEDGDPVFNERELGHMHDVKVVTQGLVRFGIGLLIVYVISMGILAISEATRDRLLGGLLSGSMLTVLLLMVGIAIVALNFNWLFAQFHTLFFKGDSWIFPTSDTLIRLYPIQFWTDAFAVMFGGALLEALIIGVMCWRLLVQRGKANQQLAL